MDDCFLNLHFIQVSYGKAIRVCQVIYFTALFSYSPSAPCTPSGVFWEVEVCGFSFANIAYITPTWLQILTGVPMWVETG